MVFRQRIIVEYDDRDDYGEERWIAIGMRSDLVVVVVVTEPDPRTIRIISFRKATRHEQRRFFDVLTD